VHYEYVLESLPILDLSRLDAGAQEADAFRAELRQVTRDVGFFYLVGHGIEQQLIDDVLGLSRRFFELPDEAKLEIENIHSAQFRGYTRVGKELTVGRVDWREQIDIGAERPTVDGGEDFWRLQGPNLWPTALPELRPVIERWITELSDLSRRLLRTWAVALGAPEDSFDAAFGADDAYPLLKIVRYPGSPAGREGQGVGEHRDGGVLTLLLVEPGKEGLQVEHEGEWIDAPALPGAFVVNIGEMFELASEGYLRATLHRVFSPAEGTDRISVPFFFNPALDARMPQLTLPPELAAEVRGVTADPENSKILEVYGENVLRYRLRAHPNVAEIHHPDLLAARAAAAAAVSPS